MPHEAAQIALVNIQNKEEEKKTPGPATVRQ
jgi:hypothetical protein